MPKHRVKSLSVGRVFNLGHYETVRYGVEIEVSPEADPSQVLKELEELMEQLRPVLWTDELQQASDYCQRVKAAGVMPTDTEQYRFYSKRLIDHQEARVQLALAHHKLATLGGDVINHKPTS